VVFKIFIIIIKTALRAGYSNEDPFFEVCINLNWLVFTSDASSCWTPIFSASFKTD
jgi:hypothetical protein